MSEDLEEKTVECRPRCGDMTIASGLRGVMVRMVKL